MGPVGREMAVEQARGLRPVVAAVAAPLLDRGPCAAEVIFLERGSVGPGPDATGTLRAHLPPRSPVLAPCRGVGGR